ncbi:hypothetical protein GPEL0_01f4093 [Geoanaerobacter pelophilus]|uniref:Uncharacterized protein n=1 Tax=Geoanaerobacter pelophilus TaxID=60036 RepID=A0ABQ0MLS3_9BACT|nr:hypothetical protein GPEL0_01f4093 [Geoanaerobacter pelophilus]
MHAMVCLEMLSSECQRQADWQRAQFQGALPFAPGSLPPSLRSNID